MAVECVGLIIPAAQDCPACAYHLRRLQIVDAECAAANNPEPHRIHMGASVDKYDRARGSSRDAAVF